LDLSRTIPAANTEQLFAIRADKVAVWDKQKKTRGEGGGGVQQAEVLMGRRGKRNANIILVEKSLPKEPF